MCISVHSRYRIFIDEIEETNVEISAAVGFENVKVFAADPWYEAQPGSIKNLKINVKGNTIMSYYKGTVEHLATKN